MGGIDTRMGQKAEFQSKEGIENNEKTSEASRKYQLSVAEGKWSKKNDDDCIGFTP